MPTKARVSEHIKSISMPTDNANLLALVKAISKYKQDLMEVGLTLDSASCKELIKNAEELAIAAREPEGNLYFQATQV